MHTLAVTNKGLVFAWGNNTKGQLGLGSSDTTSHKHPRCIVNHFFSVHLFLVFQDPCFLLNLSQGSGGCVDWVCEVCCGTHGLLLKESSLPCSYIFVCNLNNQIRIMITSLFTYLRKRC